jgi:D-alanine-D-alanine ligase
VGVRVVVAYNDDAHLKPHLNAVERLGEEEVIETAREIATILGAELMPVRDVRNAIDALRANRPELVFNLCEGVGGNPRWEMHFALALEMLRIPFTGCDPVAVGICGDKILTKELLDVAGIPTPRPFRSAAAEPPLWIVKPSREDAGIGIDSGAVCRTPEEVERRVRLVVKTYHQPALVEEFVEGREINQAGFYGRDGLVLLPPGEILFADELPPEARVVGWKAKWAAGSDEDLATVSTMLDDDTLRRDIAALTRKTASALSIGGYFRIDMRQRQSGELCVLDVNPNPDIGSDSGFRKALAAAGMAFADFLKELMMAGLSPRRP